MTVYHRSRGVPRHGHATAEEMEQCRLAAREARREARRNDPVWQQRRAETRERRRKGSPRNVTREQVVRWQQRDRRKREQRETREQLGLTAKPCPPPDWDDEDAVAAYVVMELEHGHVQPNPPSTGGAA
jgi:hypothetical protein